jgi:uncharacterized protein (TIGR00369 family)
MKHSEQTEQTLAQWEAEERAVRARLAPAGVATAADRQDRTGLELLQAIGDGTLPRNPMGTTFDFVPIRAEPGLAILQATAGEQHYNVGGSVHGGGFATLLDTAVGSAILSLLPTGRAHTTLELKVNYVRALKANVPVRAEATVIHMGGRICTAEGRVFDAAGTLYAHATTTCMTLDTRKRRTE